MPKALKLIERIDSLAEADTVSIASRRNFPTSYKLRIIREAETCHTPGSVGAMLRREGLYTSHLSKWRAELAAADIAALENNSRDSKAQESAATRRQVAKLERELAAVRKKLYRAEKTIDVQKKLCKLLGLPTADDAP